MDPVTDTTTTAYATLLGLCALAGDESKAAAKSARAARTKPEKIEDAKLHALELSHLASEIIAAIEPAAVEIAERRSTAHAAEYGSPLPHLVGELVEPDEVAGKLAEKMDRKRKA